MTRVKLWPALLAILLLATPLFAWTEKAEELLQTGQVSALRQHLDRQNPVSNGEETALLYFKAMCLSDPAVALPLLEQAANRPSGHWASLAALNAAELYYLEHNRDKALELLQKVDAGRYPQKNALLARVELAQGNWPAALAAAESYLRYGPAGDKKQRLTLTAATAALALGQNDKARRLLSGISGRDNQDYYARARLLTGEQLEKDNPAAAVDLYRKLAAQVRRGRWFYTALEKQYAVVFPKPNADDAGDEPAAKPIPAATAPVPSATKPAVKPATPKETALLPNGKQWYLQAGLFGNNANALRMQANLKKAGQKTIVLPDKHAGKSVKAIYCGPYADKAAALKASELLKTRKIDTVPVYTELK